MSYVSLAAFKQAVAVDDTIDDTELQRALDAASEWIDYYCGITFLEPIPAPVEQACIILANRWFHRPSAPFGVWEAPQTGQLGTVTDQDPDVVSLLAPYVTEDGAGSGTVGGATWIAV